MGSITEDQITEILKKINIDNDYVIESHNIQIFSEKIGLLGDHYTLTLVLRHVKTNEQVKKSYFVKCFPSIEDSATFAEGIGAFKKEIFVYDLYEKFKEHAENLVTSCIPTLYTYSHDQYIVLENLSSNGYRTIDKMRFLEYEEVLVIVQQLAKLHASSIIYEEQKSKELERQYSLIEEYKNELDESFFNDREGFPNHCGVDASVKGVLSEIDLFDFPETLASGKKFKEVAKPVLYKIYDLVKPSKKWRNVLSHGDLWATNFLIKYDSDKKPVDCKFVDFQCGRYVPPAQDVISMIYLTTSRIFRQSYMYPLLGIYYNYLEKYLKAFNISIQSIIPFNDFLESCEEQKVFAIVQTTIYFPLILISNDFVEKYMRDGDLHKKALFEDRTHLILTHKDKDSIYTKRLRDSVHDLKSICEYL